MFANSEKLAHSIGANVDQCLVGVDTINKTAEKIENEVNECLNHDYMRISHALIKQKISDLHKKLQKLPGAILVKDGILTPIVQAALATRVNKNQIFTQKKSKIKSVTKQDITFQKLDMKSN